MAKIIFGTDGWRGRIAEDYTFDSVRRCAQGFSNFLKEHKKGESLSIVIGYDKRFGSEFFALAAAEVLAANGINVFLTDGATPTPVIAFSVLDKKANGAINITASHNPWTDNGFKVRDENGGAIPPEHLVQIENLIPDSIAVVKRLAAEEAMAKRLIQMFDPKPAYIMHLTKLVDLQPIKDAGFKILVDAMWGNGSGWFTELLAGGKTIVQEIHNQRNPFFPEMERPEPIRPNIDVGLHATITTKSDVLIINEIGRAHV